MTAPNSPETTPHQDTRVIQRHGLRWHGRTYAAAWMSSHTGRRVCVRPAGQHSLSILDPTTGHVLGTAHPNATTRTDNITPAHSAQETPMTETPAPPAATDSETVGEPDFYLNLTDAKIVATEALLEAHENIADTIDARAMSCIYGDAGLGKTFSVLAALKEVAADRVLLLQFRSRPTPRGIRQELFNELHLEGEPPSHPSEFDHLLKRTLTRKPYVLVCDEAQQFSRECFEFVRHLWDTGKGKTRPAVLFVGGEEAYKTLYSEPALASRIYIWQQFEPMEPHEVERIIPLFHPLWADADPELINYVYDQGAGGSFRVWSKITYQILEGMKRRGLDKVDETIARWALSRALPHRQPTRRTDRQAG